MSIRKMRKNLSRVLMPALLGFVVVFAVSCFYGYSSYITTRAEKRRLGSDYIAVVNGTRIPTDVYREMLDRQQARARDEGSLTALQDVRLKTTVLQNLIERTMVLSAAEKRGMDVGWWELRRERGKMIDDQIDQIRRVAQGARKNPLSDKEFDLWLSRQREIPVRDRSSLRRYVQQELTTDEARQFIMMRKLDGQIRASVGPIDDNRLRESYQRLKVRQIVVEVGSRPEAQAKRRAEEILKRVKAGEDFAKLAGELSDDPTSKSKGGDIGFVDPTYDKDLQGLKVGQVSGVLKSFQGYRIVKVEDSKLGLPKDFEKNKKQLRDDLKTRLESLASAEFYENLQKSARVQVTEPELKGYWLADQANRSMGSSDERDKLLGQAEDALLEATSRDAQNADAWAELALVYYRQRKTDKALNVLAKILDAKPGAVTEGADLRLLQAQLYIETGQKNKAMVPLDIAGEMAYDDHAVHSQLASMYKSIGALAKAAKEKEWVDAYQKRMQEMNPPPAAPRRATEQPKTPEQPTAPEKPAAKPKPRP